MIDLHGDINALLPFVETIELGPIEPVGEPGDGSITWQRVLRIVMVGATLTIVLMAEERDILAF